MKVITTLHQRTWERTWVSRGAACKKADDGHIPAYICMVVAVLTVGGFIWFVDNYPDAPVFAVAVVPFFLLLLAAVSCVAIMLLIGSRPTHQRNYLEGIIEAYKANPAPTEDEIKQYLAAQQKLCN